MIGYASRTGTRRNLAALRRAGWRLIVSAASDLRTEGMRYALDNGAWTCHQQGRPFDAPSFMRAVDLLGMHADWIVLPDIVAGGHRSLELSLSWLERLRPLGAPLLLAVQDGMSTTEIAPLIGPDLGIFVGGSTEWKLATALDWGRLAHAHGAHLHVARVNTARRVRLCAAIGASSFDGTSASRFAVTLPLLDAVRRQPDLLSAAALV
ncbi:hypothetical protein [Imhoffiella purpurea]|uniref:Uncharacterized protein n=1 Tax=Imhoffiella purpurea TaxID=1249627 RepID=W9V321_9GAMM|nr:hypothetical protein [Imhoffiella purpurea]EXJ13883.1 hypothetical protein D779_3246 [Imhoffiella purpurea]